MFARRRRGGLWRWAAALVLLLVLGVVGVSVYVGWNLSHADPKPVDRTPAELGLAFEAVEFAAPDGIVLRGWFLPGAGQEGPEAATIIFAHGFRGNRLEPGVPALGDPPFVSAGFNVLMFDFRNHGESGGSVTTLGYHEVKDVFSAVRWLRGQPARAQRGIIGLMETVTSIMARRRSRHQRWWPTVPSTTCARTCK